MFVITENIMKHPVLLRKQRNIRNPLIIIFVGYPEDGGGKLLRDDGARIRIYMT
jgi:hypothetical protein